jgi:hypothetical protein
MSLKQKRGRAMVQSQGESWFIGCQVVLGLFDEKSENRKKNIKIEATVEE